MDAKISFGSQVSGWANRYCDKDLLVISQIENKRYKIKKYSNLGYSVSFYTPIQLHFMRTKGSLFLQHLKNESKIIKDKNNEFQLFINSCLFAKPSLLELDLCKNSIITANSSPREKSLSGWLADYCYVLSRDYFVKYFASKGELVFNANQLSDRIKVEFGLKNKDSELFLKLRSAKNMYRSGVSQIRDNFNNTDRWLSILYDKLNIDANKYESCNTKESYLNLHKNYSFNSSYERLRYIESLKILYPKIKCNATDEVLIKKLITRPNNYSSTSKKRQQFLNCYLMQFSKMANKSSNQTVFIRGAASLCSV